MELSKQVVSLELSSKAQRVGSEAGEFMDMIKFTRLILVLAGFCKVRNRQALLDIGNGP
jgi:hypothetical protein